jgi:glyoxylase-like metal-dependent hydrolase (beta-lactamase superfamily II)
MPVGPIEANCYLVYDEGSKEGLAIDPGAEGPKIMREIEKNGIKVKYIVNTHGHSDHIGANQYIKDATGAVLLIHEEDAPMLTDAAKNLSVFTGKGINKPAPDRLLKDGEILEVGGMSFTVLHTPGHTRGGICLFGGEACFTGDTLFQYSIGRTDFPGGSFEQLIKSIKTKILPLGDDVAVLPGHGPSSTVGRERTGNPFLIK